VETPIWPPFNRKYPYPACRQDMNTIYRLYLCFRNAAIKNIVRLNRKCEIQYGVPVLEIPILEFATLDFSFPVQSNSTPSSYIVWVDPPRKHW